MPNLKSVENLRDCVKQSFNEGCRDLDEFNAMRHAIIVGLKDLGFDISEVKRLLEEWNKRNDNKLGFKKKERMLFKYADWVFKVDAKIGCKRLNNYCIGQMKCEFYLKTSFKKLEKTQALPFNKDKLEKFLEAKGEKHWYEMMLVVKALRSVQREKETGEVMFVGYRELSEVIRDKFGFYLNPMDILRKIRLLEDEGVVEQVIKGSKGTFTRKANGYRFLPWKDAENNHAHLHANTYICVTKEEKVL